MNLTEHERRVFNDRFPDAKHFLIRADLRHEYNWLRQQYEPCLPEQQKERLRELEELNKQTNFAELPEL